MDAARKAVEWVVQNGIEVFNVAGPRASRDLQIYDDVKAVLKVVIGLLEIEAPGNGGPDESKYELADEVVAGWVEEMMGTGHERKEALETLLLVLKSGAIGAVHPQVKEYELKIEDALKSLLGRTH